jgi:hypothetical protein
MNETTYRYLIAESVPIEEVEITLLLAVIAVESLHGASQARLDAVHSFDAATRTVSIGAGTEVGADLNKLFAGFLVQEFGATSFTVQRLDLAPQPQALTEPVTA